MYTKDLYNLPISIIASAISLFIAKLAGLGAIVFLLLDPNISIFMSILWAAGIVISIFLCMYWIFTHHRNRENEIETYKKLKDKYGDSI